MMNPVTRRRFFSILGAAAAVASPLAALVRAKSKPREWDWKYIDENGKEQSYRLIESTDDDAVWMMVTDTKAAWVKIKDMRHSFYTDDSLHQSGWRLPMTRKQMQEHHPEMWQAITGRY